MRRRAIRRTRLNIPFLPEIPLLFRLRTDTFRCSTARRAIALTVLLRQATRNSMTSCVAAERGTRTS